MATYAEVMQALKAADAAGNVEDATKLAQMAANLKKEPASQPSEKVSALDYFINAAKSGPAEGIGGTIGAIKTGVQKGFIDPVNALLEKLGIAPTTEQERIQAAKLPQQVLTEETKPIATPIANVTGANLDMKAPNLGTQIIGGGIKLMTDPTTLLFPARSIASAITRQGGMFPVGVVSEVGGEVGGQVEKAITGKDTGGGRLLGSVGTSLAQAPLTGATREAVSSTANVAGQIYNKYKAYKVDPTATEGAYASGAAKRLLEKVASVEGGQVNINDIVTEYNKISQTINKENLPLLVAMSDNPALRQQVERLVKTDPSFRARVNDELSTLSQNIEQRADLLFGSRYATDNPDFAKTIQLPSVKNAEKRIDGINSQLQDLPNKVTPMMDAAQIGVVTANLIEAKQQAIRQAFKPVYEGITLDAKKAGAVLPAESTRNIYNFVTENNLRDVFGKGTPLDKDIMFNFGPKDDQFSPANFDAVISLKSRINELQRKPLTRNEERLLMELENVVNTERQNIKGDFNQRLLDVDKAYYEKLGVPFNAQGIKDIDSKKYAEQIAPTIVKNGTALQNFLTVAGDEGIDVARNAMIAEVYNKTVKNGELDRRALARYIKDKEVVVDKIPGMRELLQNTIVDDTLLRMQKSTLDENVKEAQKRISDNFAKDAATDYKSVVTQMLSSPKYRAKINKDLKDLDPISSVAVKNAIRREFIETASNNPAGAYDFIVNPRNNAAVTQIFGSSYIDAVKDIAKLSDKLKTADISKFNTMISTQDLDALAKVVPGLDIPYVTSTFRDRISSNVQKGVRLLTRWNTAKLKDATDTAFKELLLDPNGVAKLQNVAKTMDFSIKSPTDLKKIISSVGDTVPMYLYGGVKVGLEGAEQVEGQPPQEPVQFGTFRQ